MTTRRELLVTLGATALTMPFGSFAQQQNKVWRIGFLWQGDHSRPVNVQRLEAFKAGMRVLGYTEGKHYTIEHRSAQQDFARLPALAAELIALKVDVLTAMGTPATLAAHKATPTIPILSLHAGDPVGAGFAASLRRPGGNVTGLTSMGTDLYTKRLDLLRQVVPDISRVGFLYNPDNPGDVLNLKQFESDCSKLKFKSVRAPVRKADDIVAAFTTLKRDQAQGLIHTNNATASTWRPRIIEYAAKHGLPSVYSEAVMAESGGLLSYAMNYPDLYRRAATYADKIFKGANPGDLPIEQPATFDLVINIRTAKALGIAIPNSVLVQATKVIE